MTSYRCKCNIVVNAKCWACVAYFSQGCGAIEVTSMLFRAQQTAANVDVWQ